MTSRKLWNTVGGKMRHRPYYVHPALGVYKQREFLGFLKTWMGHRPSVVVKTDSFEEAFGVDGTMEWISRNCALAVGVDIAFPVISAAKEKSGSYNARWLLTDIAALPFATGTVDVLFSSSTYGYLEDVPHGLKEAYRILKPGGLFIIALRNKHNIFFELLTRLSILMKMIPFPVSRSYTHSEGIALLKEAGFSIEASEPIVSIPPLLNSALKFLNRINSKRSFRSVTRLLEAYSRYGKTMKNLTSWFIIFVARK